MFFNIRKYQSIFIFKVFFLCFIIFFSLPNDFLFSSSERVLYYSHLYCCFVFVFFLWYFHETIFAVFLCYFANLQLINLLTSLYMWKKIIKKIRTKIDLLEALINYLKLLEIIWIAIKTMFWNIFWLLAIDFCFFKKINNFFHNIYWWIFNSWKR